MFRYSSQRLRSVLVFGEHNFASLNPGTAKAVTAARQLKKEGDTLKLLVLGPQEVADQGALLEGVDSVIHTPFAHSHFPADAVSQVVQEIIQGDDVRALVGASSAVTKDFMPRLGAKMDIQPIPDVIEIGADTYKRPTYAGNAIEEVSTLRDLLFMTVRPTNFEACGSQPAAPISQVSTQEATTKIRFIKNEIQKTDRPQLSSAKIVVSGGRALKSKEGFASLLDPLCEKLRAAQGASRAAVDSGYCANDMQVGQTGKVVAPDLYLALGISGAIQHVAGMKDSKVIVAINKDADAPIFQIADYGLVADIFTAVPEICQKV